MSFAIDGAKPNLLSLETRMGGISQNRRSVATLWLLLQVLSIAVFAVRTCCLSDPPAVTANAEADCPMKHENGAACPMHRGKTNDAPCSLRAACHDDMTGLAAVFSQNGVVRDAFVLLADDSASARAAAARFTLTQTPHFTDTPPPRS